MKKIILLLTVSMLTMATPLYAQGSDINPEIANCEEIRDPATQTQVEFCTAHAGCRLVMGIQKVCTKVKTFLNNLKNLSFGKKNLDSGDVFDAASPSTDGDSAFNNIRQTIKSNYDKLKKDVVSGKFESGVKWAYEGGMKDGMRDGTGVLVTENGTLFRGDFVEGRQAGLGEMVNGKSHKAGVMAGAKIDGFGVERYTSGVRYEGEFKADKLDGKAVVTTLDGARYEGGFKAGLRSGRGTLTTSDGYFYDGDFVDGKASGKASIRYANGNSYQGEMLNDQLVGQGTYYWKDGASYQGTYLAGTMQGPGTYIWANGAKFAGEWRDGKRFSGIQTAADGTTTKMANGVAVQAVQQAQAPASTTLQAAPKQETGSSMSEIVKAVGELAKVYADTKAKKSSAAAGTTGSSGCSNKPNGDGKVCVAN